MFEDLKKLVVENKRKARAARKLLFEEIGILQEQMN